jgi:hypothetical protein
MGEYLASYFDVLVLLVGAPTFSNRRFMVCRGGWSVSEPRLTAPFPLPARLGILISIAMAQ